MPPKKKAKAVEETQKDDSKNVVEKPVNPPAQSAQPKGKSVKTENAPSLP